MKTGTRPFQLTLALSLSLTLVNAALAKPPKASGPLLAYVVLAERGQPLQGKTVALARIVVERPPAAASDDDPCARMTLSGPHGREPLSAIRARPNPDPQQFPISVCEAVLPFASAFDPAGENWTAELDGRRHALRLPTVVRNPERALIIGDSGCRDNRKQACDAASWAFHSSIPQELAQRIARDARPSLLLALGDYVYRAGKSDSKPKSWKDWQADFFAPAFADGGSHGEGGRRSGRRSQAPAHNLLAMAPWVFVRGNHELCHSSGQGGAGWFLLLAPWSSLLDHPAGIRNDARCTADGKAPETIGPAYRLDFDNRLSLLVTDSAALAEGSVVDADQARALARTLAMAEASLVDGREPQRLVWWLTHKPVWAAVGASRPKISNSTQQAALQMLPNGTPPANIQLIVSGHKHFYQSVDGDAVAAVRQPLQLVVGNGGVLINPKGYNGHETRLRADVRTASHYGFVDARLSLHNGTVDGWTLSAFAYPQPRDWGRQSAELIQTCSYPVERSARACRNVKAEYFTGSDGEDDPE